ncbi:MAG: aromatic-ring-hydroxylating dioxygenase subunit beta [Immundisolibacteraceae bacterium]|nr:aromatic-ring-hydroxylating dioxygenase subunit beta [Immundisolibacteraceae bacterium]
MERQQALEIGRDVIYREADLLDRWEWQAWSELYTEACEFWCPAWLTEVKLGEDPTQTLSHFYITSRVALQDRTWRIESGVAPFAVPVPRTCHMISNVYVDSHDDTSISLRSHWHCLTYARQATSSVYGFYDHHLVKEGDHWMIEKKQITLLNDHLEMPVDVNMV